MDFRAFLRRSFTRKIEKDAGYSLRAFAKELGLSSASLSEIMNGRQGLSLGSATRIAATLGFSETKTRLFCLLVEAQHARSLARRRGAKTQLKALLTEENEYVLEDDLYSVIADWYHLALLELLRIEHLDCSPQSLAKRLGISGKQVTEALNRLKRLRLIAEHEGRIAVLRDFVRTPTDRASEAIRKSHRQLIGKGVAAMKNQNLQIRDFSTLLLPIEPGRMSEAKRMLKSFRRKFQYAFESHTSRAEVYCLESQFFAITRSPGENADGFPKS